jgi:nucleoside-diphosphate-sugar epimerase/glycosyltransferase involved in cell wall biosynthesis
VNNDMLYSDNWSDTVVQDVKKLAGPVLIVGVSGFIGAKMFFSLSKHRDDVFGCSRHLENAWRLSNLKSSRLFAADIVDYDRLKSLILNLKPRTVFNMSAYGGYSRQKDVEKIHVTNYFGTLNLIRALSETGCDAFVQSGSSSEYGLNSAGPAEGDELVPNSDYAVSKVGASYLIKYYGRVLQFPGVNLRLNSIYGPWEERDRLIPTLIANSLQGKLPKFVDRRISRDFVFIDDCTEAYVRAALTACKTHHGQSINVSSGIKTTMETVALTAQKLFDVKVEPSYGSMVNRGWDLPDWYGNPSLASEIMGWRFTTSFERGLQLTADWEKAAAEKIRNVTIAKKAKKISVVIACYKDNQAIPVLYERLTSVFQTTGNDYEIIFVNDSSPYNDEEVITGLSDKDYHVLGISHSRNFGSQSAFLSGMDIATGDAVVLMDGDGQDPPEVIPQFIKKWEEGNDIVYGIRTKREANYPMQFFYKLFYRLFKKLANIEIPADAGDFSLIDKKAVNHLLKFSEKDVFLRGLRAWIGFKQTGVPYLRPERLFGRSTNSILKNIWWAKKAIFSFSMKPLQYIQAIGFITFAVTILLSGFYLINYFINPPSDAKGITTIVLIMLGLGSVQLISTSILGDYVGKITEEVKNRPKFIRNKILHNGIVYDSDGKIRDFVDKIKKSQTE